MFPIFNYIGSLKIHNSLIFDDIAKHNCLKYIHEHYKIHCIPSCNYYLILTYIIHINIIKVTIYDILLSFRY